MNNRGIKLRKAEYGDCELIWNWANDLEVRKLSYCSEPIPWEEHARWYEEKLNDPDCLIFIAFEGRNVPVGQVRFDLENEDAEIDVSIDSNMRRKGYGVLLIEMGIKELAISMRVRMVHAFIKTENKASINAFCKAGFKDTGEEKKKGQPSRHLIFQLLE